MSSYPGVYIEEISPGLRPISGVATSITAFVGSAPSGPVDAPTSVVSFAEFERDFGGLWIESNLGYAVRDFFLNGGSQAIIVRVNHGAAGTVSEADFIGPGKEAANQGLFALKKVDLLNLLCIPPYNPQGNVDTAVLAAAAKLCEDRRALLLVDPPSEWVSADLAKIGMAALGTTSKNAAVFFPRLRQPNPLRSNQMEDFVPSGAVAGVYARTDAQRAVWKAPAGREATLADTPELTVSLTDGDQDVLNRLGINCLRAFPTIGPVIWGSRTLQGADGLGSEWKYVPVRRLALFIEESLYRGTEWAVFEPGDERLWANLRATVGNFMHGLWQQGALLGQRPDDAYFVRCDRTTMTQGDIDGGLAIILVGFAPVKAAEFLILTIQQRTGTA